MLKEIVETLQNVNEVSDEDVEYYGELANQAKNDKKSEREVISILKDAGAPKDIIADLTQKWNKN